MQEAYTFKERNLKSSISDTWRKCSIFKLQTWPKYIKFSPSSVNPMLKRQKHMQQGFQTTLNIEKVKYICKDFKQH